MSGVRRTPSTEADSLRSKSRSSSIPAASTTRRSCSSPHWPRTLGERSACTSRPVSICSVCCAWCSDRSCSVSADVVPPRFCSTCCSFPSTCFSDSLSGCTSSSIAFVPPVEVEPGGLLELRRARSSRARETTGCSGAGPRTTAPRTRREFRLGVLQQRELGARRACARPPARRRAARDPAGRSRAPPAAARGRRPRAASWPCGLRASPNGRSAQTADRDHKADRDRRPRRWQSRRTVHVETKFRRKPAESSSSLPVHPSEPGSSESDV